MPKKIVYKKPRSEIVDEKAINLFKDILWLYEKKYEKADSVVIHIINEIALLEQRKNEYNEDISQKGVTIVWQNGDKQSGYKPHPLCSEVVKITEQIRKLLAELKITPASMKKLPMTEAVSGGGDDFDNF